jgi:dephospho-CoA kinase
MKNAEIKNALLHSSFFILHSQLLKVGLTGSIAVGKSFVSGVFKELGAAVLDADQTAREAVEPGSAGWRAIVEHFGDEVLLADKNLNRAKLGAIVFADADKRATLNSIVHPLVFARQNAWLERVEAADSRAIAVVDAALMIESGGYRRFDKIVVVWCEPKLQIERLMLRNNLSREEAESRIAAQMSQAEKKRHADFLIDSSNGFDDTRRQTIEIYQKLKDSV